MAGAAFGVHPHRWAGYGRPFVSRVARSALSTAEVIIILVIIAILLLIAIPQFTRPVLTAVAAPDSLVAPGSSGPLAVRVTSVGGTPQRGVTVRFETAGSGSVAPQEAASDSAGVAHATWRAGPDTGAFSVTARAAGRARPELVLRTRVRAAAPNASTAQR